MSSPNPDAGDEIPENIKKRLSELDGQTLRNIALYAEQLAVAAENTEADTEQHDSEEKEDSEAAADDERPEAVPAKATITIKEINDNRYYYWQWREGDSVKSQYKGPVR